MEEGGHAPYPIPAVPLHRREDLVLRSRFITSLGPAATDQAAREFIEAIRDEIPDATHHCWAFVAGPPGTTAHVGLSDAGEPHGTAGRPILNVLLHSGVGQIVAVVTRYFGGTKLGKGGLARAYAGGVALALETLPTIMHMEYVGVRIVIPFSAADAVFRLLDEVDARDREVRYGAEIELDARVPPGALERVRGEVAKVTSGEGRVVEGPRP